MIRKVITWALCLNMGSLCFGGVGIEVNSTQWDAGSGGAVTRTSPQITVTNIGDEPAKVQIRAANTSSWTLGAAPGLNTFAMQFGTGQNWTSISTSNLNLVSSLAPSTAHNFNFRFQSPSSINPIITNTQSSVVTLSVMAVPVVTTPWAKAYGTIIPQSQTIIDIRQTNDGGSIFAADYNSQLLVCKLNSEGLIIWQKLYTNMYDGTYPNCIQQTNDGGYVLTGQTNTNLNEKISFILKINSNGNILWQKGFIEGFTSIQQTNDGGYIVAGSNSDGSRVIKLYSNGALEWQKSFLETFLNTIQQTDDAGYITAGSSNGEIHNAQVLKLNSTGSIEWQKTYGLYSQQMPSIQKTTNGGYILTRNSTDVLNLNSDGTIIWGKTYRSCYSITQTDDGGYILSGEDNSITHPLITKIDSDGNIIWQKLYNPTGALNLIRKTNDGGYIAAGYTDFIGEEDYSSILLIKLNDSGACPPIDQEVTFNSTNINVTPIDSAVNVIIPSNTLFDLISTPVDSNIGMRHIAP
ncbi:MAG: hypothetical protein LHV68_01655 [Elusimicrobia bacterium]|nr:hypothetical protein [Candidatus Liberimonas magnetica]